MSYYANESDVIAQLRSAGLQVELPLVVDSPKPAIRCKTDDNQRERRGWYKLFSMTIGSDAYIVGSYGVYIGNDNGKQKIILAKQQRDTLTSDQREALRKRQQELQKQLETQQRRIADKAAARAKDAWNKLSATGSSSYLDKKQVSAHGIRFSPEGSIVIPMRDNSDQIRGLQIILPPGHPRIDKTGRNKEFWPAGLQMSGTSHLIGPIPKDILLIAEGYATGASLHQATGYPVAIVWSANNIQAAALSLHKQHRRARILICADDDHVQRCASCGQNTLVDTADCSHCGQPHRKQNAGRNCAETAALAVSGAWITPEFSESRPTDRKTITDFNDLHCLEGLRQVEAQIRHKLDTLGWLTPALAPAVDSTPGGGGKRPALKSMLNLDEALQRFALVYGGKSTMFDRQEHILVPKQDVMDIIPEHGWRDMRAHKSVVRMDEVGFDPAGTDPRITCNLYGGWPTEPKQGDCSRLLELLRYLCSNEEGSPTLVYNWVLRWLAYPIQHPGAKMQTALVFHGPQGTGKNLFFESIMAIYGEYGRIVDQAAIEDKFNDWASKKLFLIADEVVARAELYHVKNKLKSFVTGEWIRINPKNVTAHDERNHVNIVFLSNESTPLVLEHDDRRYMVIHTPDKLPAEFYSQVRAELDNGGIAALHHHLKTIDLQGFDVFTKPLATKAKNNLIRANLKPAQQFLLDWKTGDIEGIPFCPCDAAHLFTLYQRYCTAAGYSGNWIRPRPDFIRDINFEKGWKVEKTSRRSATGGHITRLMVLPPDDLLDQHKQPEGMERGYWLLQCHEAFSTAGGFEK